MTNNFHFLKRVYVVKVTQSCPTLCDPMDYIQSMEFSRPDYWNGKPFPYPGDLFQPRDQTQVSLIAGRFFTS